MKSLYPFAAMVALLCSPASLPAQSRQAPPGMFKDLDDEILGDALLIHDTQLFIDDYTIGEMQGVRKQLNQPVKHPNNPLIVRDKPWESELTYGAVVYDESDLLFKVWYTIWTREKDKPPATGLGYATSPDGIEWTKPVIDKATGTNLIVFDPPQVYVDGAGVIIDAQEENPQRRFKMTYLAKPTGKESSLSSCVGYSADGMHWTAEPLSPFFPFSDTQIAPYWDTKLNRFVAFLRFGPPNVRIISRIESEDFLHWSPKVTVVKKGKLDEPFSTELYTMSGTPYAGAYIGLLNTYHGETIQPIPDDKPWMDRVDNQLVFSRNGVTWQRVLSDGAISAADLKKDRDWKQAAEQATFLPYGEFKKDWDWGQVYPHHPFLVMGDEIRIYYTAMSGRHWNTYHKDETNYAIGMATLRLDGFVSVETTDAGTLTTKPLVFFGDTLEVNANAAGGSLAIEALDLEGNPIEGFTKNDCDSITSDGVRHVVSWKGNADCHLLQARPIKLRFHLQNAKLYSFTPRITLNHYLQSYE